MVLLQKVFVDIGNYFIYLLSCYKKFRESHDFVLATGTLFFLTQAEWTIWKNKLNWLKRLYKMSFFLELSHLSLAGSEKWLYWDKKHRDVPGVKITQYLFNFKMFWNVKIALWFDGSKFRLKIFKLFDWQTYHLPLKKFSFFK